MHRSKRIWGIVVRHLFAWPRNLENLAETFWWPTFDLVIWGFTASYLAKNQDQTSQLVAFFIGGVIFWMFVYRSQQEMG
ncbi:MAG: ABC transporter permease, partial [Patescibacteria group bacterium]